jgi:hypothetical protein
VEIEKQSIEETVRLPAKMAKMASKDESLLRMENISSGQHVEGQATLDVAACEWYFVECKLT